MFILARPTSSAEANQGALRKSRSVCKNEKTLLGLFADDWLYYAIAAQDHSPAELRLLASKRLGRLVWKWGEARSNREGLVFRFPPSEFNTGLQNLSDVGITFGGGCFFGHGVHVTGGKARFELIDFRIQ